MAERDGTGWIGGIDPYTRAWGRTAMAQQYGMQAQPPPQFILKDDLSGVSIDKITISKVPNKKLLLL